MLQFNIIFAKFIPINFCYKPTSFAQLSPTDCSTNTQPSLNSSEHYCFAKSVYLYCAAVYSQENSERVFPDFPGKGLLSGAPLERRCTSRWFYETSTHKTLKTVTNLK